MGGAIREESKVAMDGNRRARAPLKAHHHPDWKEKLRQNCLKRVQEDRAHLLWKLRLSGRQAVDQKVKVESAFMGIIAEEIKKIKQPSFNEHPGISTSGCNDPLWEYDGVKMDDSSAESDYEELLIEMERCLYEDLREELIRKELEFYEEEDEYLARVVFEDMQLNDGEAVKDESVWCPVCKRGEIRENHHLIYCTKCSLRLDLGIDKVNLEFLRNRLAEVHEEHLDKGCKAAPSFTTETIMDLTALYIGCQACNTFEIVL